MHAQPVHFGVDAGRAPVYGNDIAVHRARIEVSVEGAGAVVFDGAKERAIRPAAALYRCQIFLDKSLRHWVDWNEPDFIALSLDAEMHNTLAALHVLHAQPA